ncbi:UNVERIFIED_CONTAM: hypothetical protein NCL1_29876 [Trichonephila clavipes]
MKYFKHLAEGERSLQLNTIFLMCFHSVFTLFEITYRTSKQLCLKSFIEIQNTSLDLKWEIHIVDFQVNVLRKEERFRGNQFIKVCPHTNVAERRDTGKWLPVIKSQEFRLH